MQLYSLDDNNQFVSAAAARKGCDYRCMECGGAVRVRSGLHRRPHFFHKELSAACRLNGKSMAHLQTQLHLAALLPAGETALEWRSDTLARIADVVWFPAKLVFEVQCSFITAQEILERTNDWGQAGFQVIWILHDTRFNKWRLSAAEAALAAIPHYYTNIDNEGEGIIYDQCDRIDGGLRYTEYGPLPVNAAAPRPFYRELAEHAPKEGIPSRIAQRIYSRPIALEGDLLDRWMAEPSHPELQKLWQEELTTAEPVKHPTGLIKKIYTFWQRYVVNSYLALLRVLLEKASR